MKRILALTLIFALLLAGCGGRTPAANQPETTAPQQTQAPATEASVPETTEAATEEPTEPPVPFNPLNGEILDAPFDGRIYASTISNIPDALPHVNVVKADILMEMLVNNSIDRCLALFSDIGGIEAIGSTRSTRLMFNNITQHYNAILSHGGGSEMVISDANARGIAHAENRNHLSISLTPKGAALLNHLGWPVTLDAKQPARNKLERRLQSAWIAALFYRAGFDVFNNKVSNLALPETDRKSVV